MQSIVPPERSIACYRRELTVISVLKAMSTVVSRDPETDGPRPEETYRGKRTGSGAGEQDDAINESLEWADDFRQCLRAEKSHNLLDLSIFVS
jgi:hypothetical protein